MILANAVKRRDAIVFTKADVRISKWLDKRTVDEGCERFINLILQQMRTDCSLKDFSKCIEIQLPGYSYNRFKNQEKLFRIAMMTSAAMQNKSLKWSLKRISIGNR